MVELEHVITILSMEDHDFRGRRYLNHGCSLWTGYSLFFN